MDRGCLACGGHTAARDEAAHRQAGGAVAGGAHTVAGGWGDGGAEGGGISVTISHSNVTSEDYFYVTAGHSNMTVGVWVTLM